MIDTNRSVDTSSIDEFRQPGKSSEGFGSGSSCRVSKNGLFIEDLFEEARETIAESGNRLRTPGYGEEVQTVTEAEFTEEICG